MNGSSTSEFARHMIGALCATTLGLIVLFGLLYVQWFIVVWAFYRHRRASTTILGAFFWDRGEARITLAIEVLALLILGAVWGMR